MRSIELNHGINIMVLSLLSGSGSGSGSIPETRDNMNMEVVEKLLYALPGICGQYKESLKCLSFQQTENQKIVVSLTRMIKASTLMIRSLDSMGSNGLSYVDQLLEYVETIIETKKHLILDPDTRIEQSDLLKILDMLEKKYIETIRPMIDLMFQKLIGFDRNIMISKNTERICVEVIKIELPENLKVIDDDTLSQEYKDVITCDMVINPYYITTGTGELFLIDRKTMLSLSETKINPFTRETMDRQMIEEFNDKPEIIEHRRQYVEKINKL
jgi:hypothetical protein